MTPRQKVENLRNVQCWQYNQCEQRDCPAYGVHDASVRCWLIPNTPCKDGRLRSFRDKIRECCISCRFVQAKMRSLSPADRQQVMYEIIEVLVAQMDAYEDDLRVANQELAKKVRDLSILSDVAHALRSTLDLDEVLHIVLTGVTAGQALGLNRAFLLLMNDAQNQLEGRAAVGPSSGEEANRIWNELGRQPLSFEELVRTQMRMRDVEDSWVNHLVKKICIPVTADAGSAVRALKERCSLLLRDTPECDPEDRKLMEILGVDAIAVAPLLIGERVLGVILADNVITHAPILDADVTLLEIFAREASAAIENARLYHDREVSVCQLEEAHRILRENQERMVYSERLVAMGEMAAAIAHEIRNPLASIGGFVRSILRNSPADDPNRRYMMLVSEEVDRLEKIVVDVLTFSHRPKPEMKEVDLNEVVRQTLLLIEAEIPRGKIAVTTELSPELPRLWLDPHQFRHVLLNVMQNAIHAMPDGGELYTATRREGRTVHLEVRDSGMGIAEQHLDKIFTPFYSTKSKGFGLGLAVTQRIIEDHRGFIEVKSEEGKGTTFLISLPLEKRDGMREHVANSADS